MMYESTALANDVFYDRSSVAIDPKIKATSRTHIFRRLERSFFRYDWITMLPGHPSYELLHSICIRVEKHGNRFLVSDEKLNLFGEADSYREAMKDYEDSVVEYLEFLEAHEEELHHHLEIQLQYLQNILKPKE